MCRVIKTNGVASRKYHWGRLLMSSIYIVRAISAGHRRHAFRTMGTRNRRESRATGNTMSTLGEGVTSSTCCMNLNIMFCHHCEEAIFRDRKSSVEDEDDEKEDEDIENFPETSSRRNTAFSSKSRSSSFKSSSRRTSRSTPFAQEVLSSMKRSLDTRHSGSDREESGTLRRFTRWSLDPDGATVFYWKAVVTAAVLYNCAVVFLRTAFAEMREERIFSSLDLLCDAIYLLDILVEAKTSFLSDGCLVKDSAQTFRHYRAKPQFLNDVLAICPVHTVVVISAHLYSMFQPDHHPVSLYLKYLLVYQPVLRLNRLLKWHVMNSFFLKTESRSNNPNLLRAVKLSLHLALVIHWIACLYYMLSEYEGLGTSEWVYPLDPENTTFSRKYILCMFWSTMTLTTIGERPPPSSDIEYIFTGFTFLTGVFVFAAVVGNVGDVISNMNAARRDFQARMDQIKFYMDHRKVPEHLQTRIKRWAEYTWDRTKAIDESSVLQFLPERLKTEVAIHVRLDILRQVSIFDECEEGLLRELVRNLKPQIFSPGDYICRIGEIGREMYIINHGKVEVLFPDAESGTMKQVDVMHPGNFFGEISLLKLDDGLNKRTADVRSIGFSELLCLSRRDLMVALTEYPEAKQILEEYARQRFNNTKRMSPPDTEESRNASPRVSSSSSPQAKRSAKQTLSQVMQHEGFSKLLANASKKSEITELKAAVDELKAAKNAEVEKTLLILQQKVQDLERMLLEKSLELQESRNQVCYLDMLISRLGQMDSVHTRGSNEFAKENSYTGMNLAFRWPDLHRVNTMVHDLQRNTQHGHRANMEEKYFFDTSSDAKESHRKPGNAHTDHCTRRRSSFRNMVQRNVNSTDIFGSSSVDSLESAHQESDSRDDNSGSKSKPFVNSHWTSQRRASAPYVLSNYGHNLRTFIRRSATVLDSGASLVQPPTSVPTPVVNGSVNGHPSNSAKAPKISSAQSKHQANGGDWYNGNRRPNSEDPTYGTGGHTKTDNEKYKRQMGQETTRVNGFCVDTDSDCGTGQSEDLTPESCPYTMDTSNDFQQSNALIGEAAHDNVNASTGDLDADSHGPEGCILKQGFVTDESVLLETVTPLSVSAASSIDRDGTDHDSDLDL